ncbi:MAG TPA: calcium-binding protein [Methyloceanibacter sp.]
MAKKRGTIFTGTLGDDVADADGVFSHGPPGITGFTANNLAKLQDDRGDRINGLAGNDQVSAGPGGDTIKGGAGFDDLRGNGGKDLVDGGSDADTLDGGAGNDVVKGSAGDDLLFGSAGNDKVYGGAGNDSGPPAVVGLFGGPGNDLVDGGTGNDSLFGQEGNDLLKGSAGADSLAGGEDADRLIGGGGQDNLLGDTGQDRFVFKTKHDSGKDLVTADIIGDFHSITDEADPAERDRIDLRGLERAIDHKLHFIPDAAADNLGKGQGKYGIAFTVGDPGVSGDEVILIDLNGKAGADFAIRVDDVTALLKGDFIF